MPDETRLFSLLGEKRVVTPQMTSAAWDVPVRNAVQPYSLQKLSQVAKANRAGKADWHLVYIHGFSFVEQMERRSTDYMKELSFLNRNRLRSQISWVNAKPDSTVAGRYHLLDFSWRRLVGVSWEAQEKKIASFGAGSRRAHEEVVSEALYSCYAAHGKRLLEDWWHWGRFDSLSGKRVCIGYYGSQGILMGGFAPDTSHSTLGVVISLNP